MEGTQLSLEGGGERGGFSGRIPKIPVFTWPIVLRLVRFVILNYIFKLFEKKKDKFCLVEGTV